MVKNPSTKFQKMLRSLLVIFLLAFSFIEGAPVQSPSMPALLNQGLFIPDDSPVNFRLGFQADYMRKKRLKADSSSPEVKRFWLNTLFEMATITLNVKEWLDVYGYLGGGRTHFHFIEGTTPLVGKETGQFLWMTGAKLLLIERNDLRFGVDGKILGISSDISFDTPLSPTHFSLFEWQVSAGLSQTFSFFTPYFGVTFTNAKVRLKPFPILHKSSLKLMQKELIGIFTGFVLTPTSSISLDAEVRLINEIAFSGALDIRF